MKRSLKERFQAKIVVGEPDDCWPWNASKTKKMGYGKFARGGKNGGWVEAHRVAYELACGPVPDGIQVLHKCDYPPCCNPAHLFLGTTLDNIKDKVQKKRHRWKSHRGEANGRAKLTLTKAAEMRRRAANGESRASLARRFGVSWPVADSVVKGKTWQISPN